METVVSTIVRKKLFNLALIWGMLIVQGQATENEKKRKSECLSGTTLSDITHQFDNQQNKNTLCGSGSEKAQSIQRGPYKRRGIDEKDEIREIIKDPKKENHLGEDMQCEVNPEMQKAPPSSFKPFLNEKQQGEEATNNKPRKKGKRRYVKKGWAKNKIVIKRNPDELVKCMECIKKELETNLHHNPEQRRNQVNKLMKKYDPNFKAFPTTSSLASFYRNNKNKMDKLREKQQAYLEQREKEISAASSLLDLQNLK
jgi:hypothetical protein